MTMSGDRIGQVANAIRDDPGMTNKGIMVVAGENDIRKL